MRNVFRLQTSASVVVLGTLLAADLVAFLLHLKPSSTMLWFLVLEVFRPFDAFGSPLQVVVRGFVTTGVAAALLAVALVAHLARIRIIVGLLANLSCAFMVGLVWQWAVPHPSLTASLSPSAPSSDVQVYLVWIVCLLSAASAAASHVGFLSPRLRA